MLCLVWVDLTSAVTSGEFVSHRIALWFSLSSSFPPPSPSSQALFAYHDLACPYLTPPASGYYCAPVSMRLPLVSSAWPIYMLVYLRSTLQGSSPPQSAGDPSSSRRRIRRDPIDTGSELELSQSLSVEILLVRFIWWLWSTDQICREGDGALG